MCLLQDFVPHDEIAVKVANEILSSPHSFNVRVLVKVLTLVELTPTNENALRDLRVLTQKMLKVWDAVI